MPSSGSPLTDEIILCVFFTDFFTKYAIDNNSVSIQPRGLVNRSNYCYINATAQALLGCPSFYHLMKSIPKPSANEVACRESKTPFIDAM